MTKKIKLTKVHREVISEYGTKHIAQSIDRDAEHKHLAILIDAANAAIRAKYPEADMAVLRKYELARIDRCLKFQFPSGRVDGYYFDSQAAIVDLPSRAGCHYGSDDVFPVSEAAEKAFHEHAKLKTENGKKQQAKLDEFNAFLAACKYVDEVLEVIAAPEDIRRRLGQTSTSLVAVTTDTVKSLKATFRQAA